MKKHMGIEIINSVNFVYTLFSFGVNTHFLFKCIYALIVNTYLNEISVDIL